MVTQKNPAPKIPRSLLAQVLRWTRRPQEDHDGDLRAQEVRG
jgi:hypothetical protein